MSNHQPGRSVAETSMAQCPADDTLQLFLQGRISAAFSEHLAVHIRSCADCCRRLAGLEARNVQSRLVDTLRVAADDSFSEAFRTAATARIASAGARIPLAVGDHAARGAGRAPLPQQLGRYRVVEEIGRGGFGSVLKAFDPKLNCEVAIKLLHAFRTSSGLLEEARIVAGLRHPAIVPVINVSEDDQPDFIVMNLINGQNLKHYSDRNRLSICEILRIMVSVCEGISYAHAQGVIHRDLKPANILIDANGQSWVTDFGLALSIEEAHQTGEIAGTPDFMSPEQTCGERGAVNERSDVWSLGVLLWTLLTGLPPFHRESREATVQAIRNDPLPEFKSGDSEAHVLLAMICRRCLQKSNPDRYVSVDDLLDELRNVQDPARAHVSISQWLRQRFRGSTAAARSATRTHAMQQANRRYGITLSVILVCALFAAWGIRQYGIQSQVAHALDNVLRCDFTQLSEVLQHPSIRTSEFQEAVETTLMRASAGRNQSDRFRLVLARSVARPDQMSMLIEEAGFATAVQLREVRELIQQDVLSRELLRQRLRDAHEALSEDVSDSVWLRSTAFRTICGLPPLASEEQRDRLIRSLLAETEVAEIAALLQPYRDLVRPRIVAGLRAVPSENGLVSVSVREKAVSILISWFENSSDLVEILECCSEEEMVQVYRLADSGSLPIEELRGDATNIRAACNGVRAQWDIEPDADRKQVLDTELQDLTVMLARLNLLLARAGAWSEVEEAIRLKQHPGLRSWTIHLFGLAQPSESDLLRILSFPDATQVSACLLSMAKCRKTDPLVLRVLELYGSHADSGVHFAADWLLRAWAEDERLEAARAAITRRVPAPGMRWIEHESGIGFAILPGAEVAARSLTENDLVSGAGPQGNLLQIPDGLAIAVRELNLQDFQSLGLAVTGNVSDVHLAELWLGCSVAVPRESAQEFCRRFSDRWEVCASIPSVDEWEYACRAGTVSPKYWGPDELISEYEFSEQFSGDAEIPKKPNPFGLFHLLSNELEYCQGSLLDDARKPPDRKRTLFKGFTGRSFVREMDVATVHFVLSTLESPMPLGVRPVVRF